MLFVQNTQINWKVGEFTDRNHYELCTKAQIMLRSANTETPLNFNTIK